MRRYTEWVKASLCTKAQNPNTFFHRYKVNEAKSWCQQCPVEQDCLDYALMHEEQGIWGGTTELERDAEFNEFYRARLVEQAKALGIFKERLTADEVIRALRPHHALFSRQGGSKHLAEQKQEEDQNS